MIIHEVDDPRIPEKPYYAVRGDEVIDDIVGPAHRLLRGPEPGWQSNLTDREAAIGYANATGGSATLSDGTIYRGGNFYPPDSKG